MSIDSPSRQARRRMVAPLALMALLGAWAMRDAAGQPSGSAQTVMPTPGTDRPDRGDDARIARGRYLAVAGDCVACHTLSHAAPFSGGRAVQTPFGAVLSANLTPDIATGIGRYDGDTFYRALHEGIDREGRHLYPAFPYPSYTRLTREDSDAIYAYLRSLKPVSHSVDRNQLRFPFNVRALMGIWNMLFLDKGPYRPDPARSPEWNRGAYLVQGLGHCEACHTPRDALGGPRRDEAFRGGRFADWFAPDITQNRRTGIGSWSREQLMEFLRDGRNVHGGASGEMAEVVSFSTSQLNDADLAAVTGYITTLAPSPDEAPQSADKATIAKGEAIWLDACAACHRDDGRGVPRMFPPMKGNANAQQRDPTTMLHYILAGAQHRPTDDAPTPFSMPAFAWKLDDTQIAAVATYARNSWGNVAAPVQAPDVTELRRALQKAHAAMPTWPPAEAPSADLKRPGPSTLSSAETDSRDNGTSRAGAEGTH